MKKDEERVNYEDLNKAISTGNRILNLFYVLMIFAIVGAVALVCKALNIFPIIFTIFSIMVPFFIGFVLAWLLNPAVNKLTEKGMKRTLAVAVVYLLLAILLYLFCLAVIPSLVTQLNEFAKMIPDYILKVENGVSNFFTKISNSTNINMDNVKADFIDYLENFGSDLATDLPSKLISVVQDIISGIGKFLVGLIIGFYLSLNFHNVNKIIMNIVPKKLKKDAEFLISSISEVLYKFVNGTLLLSLLLFVVSVIGFSIIGLKTPVLFALFCAVTNIIPYVGPYIGAAPAVAVAFTQSPLTGVLVLAFILLTQLIDGNILNPIVIGKQTDLHPITIIISLLIFEHFFGIIGMVIATPVVAILKIIYVFLDEKYDFFGYTKTKSIKKEISKVKLSK